MDTLDGIILIRKALFEVIEALCKNWNHPVRLRVGWVVWHCVVEQIDPR